MRPLCVPVNRESRRGQTRPHNVTCLVCISSMLEQAGIDISTLFASGSPNELPAGISEADVQGFVLSASYPWCVAHVCVTEKRKTYFTHSH